MFTPIKINTAGFDGAIRQIARYTGAPVEQVVDHEFAKVIEAAIRFTPAADASKIRAESEKAQLTAQPPDLYTPQSASGIRDRKKAKLKGGKLLYNLAHRYPDALWSAITQRRKASLQRRLHARGLAKQSWLMIASALGIDVRAPAFVKKALPRSGAPHPGNASAVRRKVSGQYGIHGTNSYPLIDIPTVRGRHALQRAIDGRVKFFRRNLELGVFFDLAKIARAYPGMRLRR